jgi:hypothetical protein
MHTTKPPIPMTPELAAVMVTHRNNVPGKRALGWLEKRGTPVAKRPRTGRARCPCRGASAWWGTESTYTALGSAVRGNQRAPLRTIDSGDNEQPNSKPRLRIHAAT